MRQQVQGEEEFPDEAQSRDYVQQEVSCAFDEDPDNGREIHKGIKIGTLF